MSDGFNRNRFSLRDFFVLLQMNFYRFLHLFLNHQCESVKQHC